MGTLVVGCGLVARASAEGGIEIYLGRRRDDKRNLPDKWSLFCGRTEPWDSNIRDTAARETRQEIQTLCVVLGDEIGVYRTPGIEKHVFEVRRYHGEPRANPDEFKYARWFKPEEILALPENEVTFGTKEPVSRYLEMVRARGYV